MSRSLRAGETGRQRCYRERAIKEGSVYATAKGYSRQTIQGREALWKQRSLIHGDRQAWKTTSRSRPESFLPARVSARASRLPSASQTRQLERVTLSTSARQYISSSGSNEYVRMESELQRKFRYVSWETKCRREIIFFFPEQADGGTRR